MRMRKTLWTTLVSVAVATALALPAGAAGPTVYDNIPSPQPGNVPSVAYEANGIAEWGGQVELAGTERQNPTVTVLMSSWGCQSGHWFSNDCVTGPGATFPQQITLSLYNVGPGDNVGSLIASLSHTFNIPYRPSADLIHCSGGTWYSASEAKCYNGLAIPISFTFPAVTLLPSKLIVSVAYNTSHYGSLPYGQATACYTSSGGCGYDSLNVGTGPGPTVGSDPLPDDAYTNSVFGSVYCDAGVGGTGTFRLDAAPGCWTGFQPAFRIAALTINPPPNKDACKGNGWQIYTRADGSKFKNQGDCIQYANTGK